MEIFFSGHAVRRMFERRIGKDDVLQVILHGEVISDYPEDDPHPSRLMLGFAGERALHAVVAVEGEGERLHVVTVYDPDPDLWEPDFKRRKKK